MAESDNDILFDADFLNKLERLSILVRRPFPGVLKGDKRSPRRGHSVEFADFRNYTPGDDFRRVDWNVYGRLEKLFLKLFVEEEDLTVYVLIDGSKSMDFGEPRKFDYARRLAAAMGYVALMNLDRVAVGLFTGHVTKVFPSARGRHETHRLFDFLRGLEIDGRTDMNRALTEWAVRHRRPGVAFIISDFLDPTGYERGMTALMSKRNEVNVIHLFDDFELDPDVRGDLRLIDSETQDAREITVSGSMLAGYKRSVEGFCQRLQAFCHGRDLGYMRLSTSWPFEDLVLRHFRRRQFVK